MQVIRTVNNTNLPVRAQKLFKLLQSKTFPKGPFTYCLYYPYASIQQTQNKKCRENFHSRLLCQVFVYLVATQGHLQTHTGSKRCIFVAPYVASFTFGPQTCKCSWLRDISLSNPLTRMMILFWLVWVAFLVFLFPAKLRVTLKHCCCLMPVLPKFIFHFILCPQHVRYDVIRYTFSIKSLQVSRLRKLVWVSEM